MLPPINPSLAEYVVMAGGPRSDPQSEQAREELEPKADPRGRDKDCRHYQTAARQLP